MFLQTDHVEVGCFKRPELVRMIKDVERHYNSPAIVTSGYRPPKGIRQGSKHYTCDAADIQIKGVSKWELATYLRSLPDRGGWAPIATRSPFIWIRASQETETGAAAAPPRVR